jgi:hypothetical protein
VSNIPFVPDWWKLWRMRRYQQTIRDEYQTKTDKLRMDKTSKSYDFAELDADEYFETKMLEEAKNAFLSNRLIEQAARFDVEVPPVSTEGEFWTYTDDGDRVYLTAKGRALIRGLVHIEKERHAADWDRRLKASASIIGVLAALCGAATGVILALKK